MMHPMRGLGRILLLLGLLLFGVVPVQARAGEPPAAVDVTLAVHVVVGDGQRRALAPGAALRSGERFVVVLVAARPAHVYVAHVHGEDPPELLLTAQGQREVLVLPGEEIMLPGGDQSYGVPEGSGAVVAVAAERALSAAEQQRQLVLAAKQPPPPPPPPPRPPGGMDIKQRPGLGPDRSQRSVRATAARGRVAHLRFPLLPQPGPHP